MPDIVYTTLEEIPEGLRDGAVKKEDGKFIVKVVLQARLDEFRERNITVSQERDALNAQIAKVKPFVGEDPDAFAKRMTELEEIATKVKDGSLKGTDAITAEVNNRVEAMKADFQRQLQEQAQLAVKEKNNASGWEERYNKTKIDAAVTDAVLNPNSGALGEALADIKTRAYAIFKVGADGNIIAMDGQAIKYGADGTTPMTPLEWLLDLRKKAPYLFKGSSGGGAQGGSNSKDDPTFGLGAEKFNALKPEDKLKLVHQQRRTNTNNSAFRVTGNR